MRDDGERLRDILEAIERIDRYARRGRKAFEDDELVQIWVVHHIEIIGEAARGVSQDLRDRHTGVPWAAVIAMRNVLVHEYFGIDVERVWAAVDRDLPRLRDQIEAMLEKEAND